MTEYDVELLGFYRTRLAESWQQLESVARHLPDRYRAAVLDHVAKARSVTAKLERLREEQLPFLDDMADFTGELGND